MIVDSQTIGDGAQLVADICVVGAGPAGLAIARRLEGSGLRVLLLESGGPTASVAGQNLNRAQNDGHDYWPLHSTRVRALGGTGNRWAGWCRPFDEIDFEDRSWVPLSGWPVRYAEVARYYPEAERFLRLPDRAFDATTVMTAEPWQAAAEVGFEPVAYRFSPLVDMGGALADELAASREATVVLHATVTNLSLGAGSSRVESLAVRGRADRTFEVRAGHVVLAAGGIENPRLLLAARSDRPAGLGNEHDVVGRYFMEHLHAEVGTVVDADPAIRSAFFGWTADVSFGRGALAGDARTQRAQQLLPISLTVMPGRTQFGQRWMRVPPALGIPVQRAVRATPAGIRRLGREAWRRGRQASRTVGGLPGRGVRHLLGGRLAEPDLRRVHARSEQVPNPDSRVTLGSAVDRYGMPVARLDWRLSAQDMANLVQWTTRFERAVTCSGDARLERAELVPEAIIGGPHHMGTTRMSADARTGVVDAACRVHSVDNLFVAGSSVFATGGYANPTFTLVALAIRLADHLRDRTRRPVRVSAVGAGEEDRS